MRVEIGMKCVAQSQAKDVLGWEILVFSLTVGWSMHAQKTRINVATNSAKIGLIHFWKKCKKFKAGWVARIWSGIWTSWRFERSISSIPFLIFSNSTISCSEFNIGKAKNINVVIFTIFRKLSHVYTLDLQWSQLFTKHWLNRFFSSKTNPWVWMLQHFFQYHSRWSTAFSSKLKIIIVRYVFQKSSIILEMSFIKNTHFYSFSSWLLPFYPENFRFDFLFLISSMFGLALQVTLPGVPDKGLFESVEDTCDMLWSSELPEPSSKNRMSLFFDKSMGVLNLGFEINHKSVLNRCDMHQKESFEILAMDIRSSSFRHLSWQISGGLF